MNERLDAMRGVEIIIRYFARMTKKDQRFTVRLLRAILLNQQEGAGFDMDELDEWLEALPRDDAQS